MANRLASNDAVFTFNVGSPTIWAARYLTMNGRRRTSGSFTHGTMACALPHAIGAQTAAALVDGVVARQELSIPPAISAEQAKGFTLWAIRTILAGRADELLDLVSTNVARRILD